MDRISELPQGILHHILSFLSQKQAVQTCVLSKSWRYVWSTRPKIDFYEHCFYGNRETFMFALDKTLQGYHDQKLYIQEFRVWMSIVDPKSISLLEKWIPKIVIDMRVKTFKLYLHSNKREYFDLPSVVFKAESLQKLYMHRCKLSQNPLDKVLFKHLQTLSLTLVYIVDETFEKIMSSCPLIENLFLESCKGLKTIKVNKGCNLKDFVWLIDGDGDDCSVEFNTPTLETIKFIGIVNWFHRHNKYFPHLKSLYLSKVRLASWSSDMFSCNYMPTLEELTIRYCFDFKEFQLSNNSIKNLTIASLQDPTNKFVIDAPNIVKFDYVGYISPSIVFATTSSEWKSDICVCYDVDFDDNDASSSWFFKI
ncbi:hypothetical protein DH2020_025592 [Rehmannia glutinosa]|uniref:F-box domain-containing protein n=1 Tax=Rehmannia glutinosa TaxID=99300 RepID=A0ABR0W1N4_REHGL